MRKNIELLMRMCYWLCIFVAALMTVWCTCETAKEIAELRDAGVLPGSISQMFACLIMIDALMWFVMMTRNRVEEGGS